MDIRKNKKSKKLPLRFKKFLTTIKSSGPRPKRPKPKQKSIILNEMGTISPIMNSSGPRPKRRRRNDK